MCTEVVDLLGSCFCKQTDGVKTSLPKYVLLYLWGFILVADHIIFSLDRYGKTEAIEKLMDRQNARILNLQNSQGKTALHFACMEGHDLSAEVLLRLGATIEKYVSMIEEFLSC